MVINLLLRELEDAQLMVDLFGSYTDPATVKKRERLGEYIRQLTAAIRVLRSLAGEKLLDSNDPKRGPQ